MDDASKSLLVLAVVVALYIWNRLPVEIVAIGTALALYALGLVDVAGAFAGFGDPVVPFIASLFVVSEGIDSTGVTAWAGQRAIALVGNSPRRLLVLTMVLGAGVAALISPNGAVAALLPMAGAMAVRARASPSGLAMPLAFAASAGSLLVLTGTPVNVLVSYAAARSGGGGLGFFDIGIVGAPLVLGTIAITTLLGPRVLPERRSATQSRDLSAYARTLVEQYSLDGGLYRLRVRPGSPLVGTPRAALDLKAYEGIALTGVQSGARVDAPVGATIAEGDVLVVRGDPGVVSRLVLDQVLAVTAARKPGEAEETLIGRDLGVVEIVIPPRSKLIGEAVFPGVRTSGGLLVLAVLRRGRDVGATTIELEVGDALLVHGTWEALRQTSDDHDLLVVDAPDLVRRQAVPMGVGAKRALATLAAMVTLLAFDIVPAAVAGVLAAMALVVFHVVRVEQAYRAISWSVVLVVAGLIPLATVVEETGAANMLARVLIAAVGSFGPYALLAGVFVLANALSQILGTMATALIVIPVALAAAGEVGISPRPLLVTVTVAVGAAFLTPISTSANMMVTGPGGYRFGDFWKLGLPIVIWFFLVTMLLIPIVWPF